jgi:hypothetical protein
MKHLDAMLLTAVTGAITWGFGVLMWPPFLTLGATLRQITQALQLQP